MPLMRISERAAASEPRERPAFARSASARSRRSFSGGASAPAKRRARERVGESEGRSPSAKTRTYLTNVGLAFHDASEHRERARRTERAGEAARERACRGVRGAKPLG